MVDIELQKARVLFGFHFSFVASIPFLRILHLKGVSRSDFLDTL